MLEKLQSINTKTRKQNKRGKSQLWWIDQSEKAKLSNKQEWDRNLLWDHAHDERVQTGLQVQKMLHQCAPTRINGNMMHRCDMRLNRRRAWDRTSRGWDGWGRWGGGGGKIRRSTRTGTIRPWTVVGNPFSVRICLLIFLLCGLLNFLVLSPILK